MAVQVGTEKVSRGQRQWIEMLETGTPNEIALDIYNRISRDADIREGRETLDPRWLELFDQFVETHGPARVDPRIIKFFRGIKRADRRIGELDPNHGVVTFLLGAGASKPEPSGIPTVQELLPDLLVRARRLDREEVTRLAAFCEEASIRNIEDLLTAAQVSAFCGKNPNVLRLVEFLLFRGEAEEVYWRHRRLLTDVSSVAFLQDTLQLLFSLLSTRMLEAAPNPAHDAIAHFLSRHKRGQIVTTNYDCCMDRALAKAKLPFTYKIGFRNGPAEDNSAKITLNKLHGSLNWFYCDTCQEVFRIDIEDTVTRYIDQTLLYPAIGVCRGCGGQNKGLLVPPLAMKFDLAPPLNPLIEAASQAFRRSDLIVVVGFSFAEADLYISRMVSKAMQASEKTRMVIFDPDRSVVDRLRRKFATRIPEFDEERIIACYRNCAITLPEFLEGKMMSSGAAAEPPPSPTSPEVFEP